MKQLGLLRRAAVATATGALILGGLATAQSASADLVDGGTLVSGKAVTADIKVENREISYSFVAEKGEHIAFSTSTSTWNGSGAAQMNLYVPVTTNGKSSYVHADRWYALDGKTALYEFTANTTATWKLTVVPGDAKTTGSTTFTYAADVYKGAMEHNTAIPAATTVPGQNIVYFFKSETVGKDHISLDVTASNWGAGGTANGNIYNPAGVLADVLPLAAAPTFYDFVPDMPGYYKFVVDPNASAVGSLSLTLATDQLKGQLQTNTPVTATITSKGSRAVFGVYGVAGEELPIDVAASNWGATGSAYLLLFPAGSDTLIGHCVLTNAATDCPFYPTTTGAYRLVLDPNGGSVGSATVKRLT